MRRVGVAASQRRSPLGTTVLLGVERMGSMRLMGLMGLMGLVP
jgi:hypothetical protein